MFVCLPVYPSLCLCIYAHTAVHTPYVWWRDRSASFHRSWPELPTRSTAAVFKKNSTNFRSTALTVSYAINHQSQKKKNKNKRIVRFDPENDMHFHINHNKIFSSHTIVSSMKSIGSWYRCSKKNSRSCLAVYILRAVWIVMKFFSDFDIFRPRRCKWPEWRKYFTQPCAP